MKSVIAFVYNSKAAIEIVYSFGCHFHCTHRKPFHSLRCEMFNSCHYVFSDKTQYGTQQRSPLAYSEPSASADCSHWLRGQGGGMSQQVFWKRQHMWTVFRSLYSLPTQNWFRQEMPCSEEHRFDMIWREPLVGPFDVSCSKRQEQALVNISDRAVSF